MSLETGMKEAEKENDLTTFCLMDSRGGIARGGVGKGFYSLYSYLL